MKAKLIKEKDGRFHLWLNVGTKDADHIASNEPLVGEWGRNLLKYKLSLKNCQAIERGYDLDELLDNITPKNGTTGNISERIGFVKGFQKCLELMGDKKFSEDDMRKAIEIARKGSMQEQHNGYGMSTGSRFILDNLPSDNIIQSIQQTEWDVTFNSDEFDADGCLILKRV